MAQPGLQVQGVPAPPSPPSPPAQAQAGQQAPHQSTQQQPAQQRQQILHLNWSHLKPEFSGKPEKDAEAHLLCTND